MRPSQLASRIFVLGAFIFLALVSANNIVAQPDRSVKKRDINVVLAAHDKELLKLPNVTGVYVGLLEDGKTACLKVMLTKKSPDTEAVIPANIEGYRVVTEVTGEIRPLAKP